MDELEQLAYASSAAPSQHRRKPLPAQRDPVAFGFLAALGAAPVLLAVLLLSAWLGYELVKHQIESDIWHAADDVARLQK